MAKMMAAMAADPTGDVDRDFVAMMVPHHQGAIAMAVGLLRYGRNERLKRLAQEIIVTQQAEIAAMRQAIGEPLPPSMPSPTTPSAAPAQAAMAHARPRVDDEIGIHSMRRTILAVALLASSSLSAISPPWPVRRRVPPPTPTSR